MIALGWLDFFILVGSGEVSKVGAYTFLIPLIANIISILFLHESITVNLLVGLCFILVSIYLVNLKKLETKKRSKESVVEEIDSALKGETSIKIDL